MSTPFSFFRRNSQVMMVAVVILSMLAFTLDMLFSDRGTHFVLLGLLMGAMIFSFFGIRRGQWMKFGIAGAVLGAVCGFVFPKIVSPAAGFYHDSALGHFDDQRMMELQQQRNIPNTFLQHAFEKAIAPGMGMYAPQFNFRHQDALDELTFTEMMRAEADSLGIVVTDKMVSNWINKATQEKLSREDFADIRQKLNFGDGPISESKLLECFRNEIKAMMAYQILRPQPSSMPQGPDVYYATFKRTKVRERLNTVRLDVDGFTGQVADPSEAEIATLFQEGRLRFPNELEPGSPGFRQFSKAKLGYLELGYKKVESSVVPPVDAEVDAFYIDNKDKLYRKPAEKPAAPEEPKAEVPKAEVPKAEVPASDAAPADKANPTDQSDPSNPTDQKSGQTEDQCSPIADEPAAASPEAPAADAQAPAAPPAADAPAEAATDKAATDKTATPDFVIPQIEYKPLDDELRAEIREQMLDAKVRTALDDRLNTIMIDVKTLEDKRSGYRFSLFEKNRDISPDELYEKMRENSSQTLEAMKELATKHGCEFVETPLLTYTEMIEGESVPIGAATVSPGETVAQRIFSTFPEDVTNDTTLFVGQRAIKNEYDPDGGETRYAWVITEHVLSHVPTLNDAGIRDQVVLEFKRTKARDLVKARAVELVKEIEAGLAKPEGEKKTMSETLDGKTLLGTQDSTVLAMRQTLPFSWMEQAMTPQMNFMQQPTAELSSIRFADEIAGAIRYAGPKFMQVVFEDIDNNGVEVVPNDDFSSYYVVQVLDRTPSDTNGEEILEQQFLTEAKQFGFRNGVVASVVQNDVAGPTALEWEKNVWRKYGIDPDERRED